MHYVRCALFDGVLRMGGWKISDSWPNNLAVFATCVSTLFANYPRARGLLYCISTSAIISGPMKFADVSYMLVFNKVLAKNGQNDASYQIFLGLSSLVGR